MSGHTPGPWFYDDFTEGLYAKDSENLIGRVEPASGRLAAAAPTMLEALENLENDDGSIPRTAWNMVLDAVEVATGRRPNKVPDGNRAALTAAAPSLLDALEGLVAELSVRDDDLVHTEPFRIAITVLARARDDS